jgi:hypothetical protein
MYAMQPLALREVMGAGAGDHDRIAACRQALRLDRESLPQESLDPVSLDRTADLARDR